MAAIHKTYLLATADPSVYWQVQSCHHVLRAPRQPTAGSLDAEAGGLGAMS